MKKFVLLFGAGLVALAVCEFVMVDTASAAKRKTASPQGEWILLTGNVYTNAATSEKCRGYTGKRVTSGTGAGHMQTSNFLAGVDYIARRTPGSPTHAPNL